MSTAKQPHDSYGDWIQKERNGFWINQKTKKETLFHPKAVEIGSLIYSSYRKLKPTKGKK